jgi:germacradienol/geosmin synthase
MRSSRYMNEGAVEDAGPPGGDPRRREIPILASRRTGIDRSGSGPFAGVLGGLGGPFTSASRIKLTPGTLGLQRIRNFSFVPYTPVGHLEVPALYMPFKARLSPHLASARANSKAWARSVGMLDVVPGVPGGYIWDDHKFDAADVALCGAMIHADATRAQLEITAGWLVWGTYADDYFPAIYGRARDMVGAKVFNARLSAFMPIDDAPATSLPLSPVERGLADLWRTTAGAMPRESRRLFRKAIEDMTESWLWELANLIQNRVPDPIDYLEMRRKTFGSDLTMSLSRLTLGDGIPPELFQTRAMRGIDNSAADYACLTNDVFSYQKEIEFEGELHNAVLVFERFLDCDSVAAVPIVRDLMTSRMQQFEHLVANELPAALDDLALDKAARGKLARYITGLQNWMAGVMRWHETVTRYKEFELRNTRKLGHRPGRLAGLGTSAARLASLYSGKH